MRRIRFAILCLLLFSCSSAFALNKAVVKKLAKRAYELTGKTGGYFFDIPRRANARETTDKLAKMLFYQSEKNQPLNQPLIIYGSDADFTAHMIHAAFSTVRPTKLRGTTVICVVGPKYDSYLRELVSATGAKLYIEPLP